MTAISNLDKYLLEMDKSLFDKLFFIGKVDAEFYIDYGCGGGSLIEFMLDNFESYQYLAYDFNEKIVDILKEKFESVLDTFVCVSNEKRDITKFNVKAKNNNKKSCLILSSVLHEIYNYDNPDEFWNFIQIQQFDYISIRDMIPSFSIDRPSDLEDCRKLYKHPHQRLKYFLHKFENFNGKIYNNKNLIHFLLKCDFVNNWEREIRENYLILNKEELYGKIPNCYEIIYEEHYILPYFKEKCKKLGIIIKDNTHLKMILKLKEK